MQIGSTITVMGIAHRDSHPAGPVAYERLLHQPQPLLASWGWGSLLVTGKIWTLHIAGAGGCPTVPSPFLNSRDGGHTDCHRHLGAMANSGRRYPLLYGSHRDRSHPSP